MTPDLRCNRWRTGGNLSNVPEPIYLDPSPEVQHRRIRTFHARHGRVSQTRNAAIDAVLPNRDIALSEYPVVLNLVLGGTRAVIDFGCGMGGLTRELLQHPDTAVLAIDVHTPGIADLAQLAVDNPEVKLALHMGDGIFVLEDFIAPESIDSIYVYFPDPWPKARHQKRRVIQPYFLDIVHQILKPGGTLKIATDIDSYAAHVRTVAATRSDFTFAHNDFEAVMTSYHTRAIRLGHTINTFTLTKI